MYCRDMYIYLYGIYESRTQHTPSSIFWVFLFYNLFYKLVLSNVHLGEMGSNAYNVSIANSA